MFLKLKGPTGISDLLRCLPEKKKTFSLFLNKIIWHVKSSCSEQGASAIGLVIALFFMFLLILLPMNLFVQEINLYRIMTHKVQMATEMACFDTFIYLDANALSEENLVLDRSLEALFEIDLKERMKRTDAIDVNFEGLHIAFQTDQRPNRLHVKFDYLYDTRFVMKGHLTKKVGIELSYELPMNN